MEGLTRGSSMPEPLVMEETLGGIIPSIECPPQNLVPGIDPKVLQMLRQEFLH